jgi:hypothetical protein
MTPTKCTDFYLEIKDSLCEIHEKVRKHNFEHEADDFAFQFSIYHPATSDGTGGVHGSPCAVAYALRSLLKRLLANKEHLTDFVIHSTLRLILHEHEKAPSDGEIK